LYQNSPKKSEVLGEILEKMNESMEKDMCFGEGDTRE